MDLYKENFVCWPIPASLVTYAPDLNACSAICSAAFMMRDGTAFAVLVSHTCHATVLCVRQCCMRRCFNQHWRGKVIVHMCLKVFVIILCV